MMWLLACVGAATDSGLGSLNPTDTGWWSVITYDTSGGGGDSGDTADDFEGWHGEGYIADNALTGHGDFLAEQGGTAVCQMSWDWAGSTPRDDCDQCEFAWDLLVGPVTDSVLIGCEEYNLSPEILEGSEIAIGYGANTMYTHAGDNWGATGTAEYDTGTGAISWQYRWAPPPG